MARRCSKSLHETIRIARQQAYDASQRSGRAGSIGSGAVLYAKLAETHARNGRCKPALEALEHAMDGIDRAWAVRPSRSR